MSDCDCTLELKNQSQRKSLYILLTINALMFFFEFVLGLIAESTGLIADSLDMFSDAAVYGMALCVVGRPLLVKIKAALLSGILEIILAMGVFIDILRRFVCGSEPISFLMIGVGLIALIANIFCLFLLYQHKDREVHMRATWIFSKNDVIANVGIILSGLLVYLLDSRYPDLIIGSVIVFVVLCGGVQIIKEAIRERQPHKMSL